MDDVIFVEGKKRLYGEVIVGGSKNSALSCIAGACMCTDGKLIELKNVPDILDIYVMRDIINALGKKAEYSNNTFRISGYFNKSEVPSELAGKLRASTYFLGVLLGSMGEVTCGLPGGDNIGDRPIDIHLNGFKKLGAELDEDCEEICLKSRHKLEGKQIYLKYPSVGATCNIMMAACRATGKTIIENAAKEPEIVDLSSLLREMGVKIIGAGTDRIIIHGGNQIHGSISHEVISDRIEAGVLAIATTMCGGKVMIKKSVPYHNYPLISILSEIGAEITSYNDEFLIKSSGKIEPFQVSMMPFPGVATDLQPSITALATKANGTSTIVDHVFENRFQYIKEMQKMGSNIEHIGNTLKVHGSDRMISASVSGGDIRAVSALICAALISEGRSEISGLYHLRRGYPNLEHKLSELGAKVSIGVK